jgi:hypothetical protein
MRGPAYQHDPRASLPHHRTRHAWPHRHTTSHRPPRVPCCMGATAATCLRVLPRCLPCHALLHCRYYLPAYHCSPPLLPLLSTAALLLRHSEKLPPSSLRCPPPRSRNLPQIAHRPKQAEAVHHPPLQCLAVDSTPPILSWSAATSPS